MKKLLFLSFALAAGLAACATAPNYDHAMANYQQGRSQDAAQELQRLVTAGDTRAMVQLGQMYQTGAGVGLDIDRATELYAEAAAKEDIAGELRYADMELWRYGDYVRAMSTYQQAAAKGSSGADAGIWYMYLHGMGVPADQSQAAHFYALAYQGPEGQFQIMSLQIKDAINSKKIYPKTAVLGGHTGTAVVSFDYFGGGKASHPHIDRSTGSADLDAAAIQAVLDADMPDVPPTMRGVSHFVVAVNFALGG